MKKLITVAALVLAMAFTLTGCSLFSNKSVVKFDDNYTHEDPKGLKYDTRIALQGEGFDSKLEDEANTMAYPDTMMYDEDGNVTGMYDYDPETGLAKGWTDFADGTYTEYKAGEEVDLGMPDESMLIDIKGDVTMAFVVYGNKDKAVSAYMYLFLSDSSDKDTVKKAMNDFYGIEMTDENDTVLKFVQDEAYIDDQFKQQEDYGLTVDTKDAKAYADVLSQLYGVREYGGKNPYKPYDGHEDPTDVEFDEKVVLTGSGQAAVTEDYAEDVASMTDYVYGYKGDVVAQYTYIEATSKEAADTLINECYVNTNAERVSDTVIEISLTGQNMKDTVSAYIGYNVLKDTSLDDYVRMLQETYFTSIYK